MTALSYTHTQNTVECQPNIFLTGIHHLLDTNKGRPAFCQRKHLSSSTANSSLSISNCPICLPDVDRDNFIFTFSFLPYFLSCLPALPQALLIPDVFGIDNLNHVASLLQETIWQVLFFVSNLHFENKPFLPLVQPTYLKVSFGVPIQIPLTYKSHPLLWLLTTDCRRAKTETTLHSPLDLLIQN